jgi:hypothetical protein
MELIKPEILDTESFKRNYPSVLEYIKQLEASADLAWYQLEKERESEW